MKQDSQLDIDLDVWTHRSIGIKSLGAGDDFIVLSQMGWVLHILWDSRNGRSRLYKSILLLSLLLHLSVNMNLTSVDGAEIEKEGFKVGTARRRVKQRCARGQDAVVGLALRCGHHGTDSRGSCQSTIQVIHVIQVRSLKSLYLEKEGKRARKN